MKKGRIVFPFLLLILPFPIQGQHLVVGFTDPNEVVTITNTTVQHDTVLVMNNGRLIIDNADFTVNQALIVRHTGSLVVKNSNFIVNGNSIFFENGSATLKDNLTFRGDILDLGNASLKIDSAEVSIPMNFVGQYRFIGADSAEFVIGNSTFNFENGKLGGGFVGQSSFTQLSTIYQTQVGISMTLGIAGQTTILVDNCTGGMEFVISDSADVDIRNSTAFILWHTLAENSQADMTFPPPNSVITNASDVSSYIFSDALPGISGIHYAIDVQNTNIVFWGLLPDATSDVTVNNSTVIACGFRYQGVAQDTVSGFINDSSYVSFTAPLSDRSFNLNNSIVKAWNFYPQDNAQLVIKNSIFGEALTFGESMLTVENSICDGTGGFFGANQNSKIHVKRSIIKRIGSGPDIMINRDDSKVILDESAVIGEVVINDASTLIYSNMDFDHEPVVNNAAFFLETSLDSVLRPNPASITPVNGTLRAIAGPQNFDTITGYKLEFSEQEGSSRTLIADLPFTGEVTDGLLSDWNTQGVPAGDYLLWFTTFVNGDSLLTTTKEITLSTVTAVEDNQNTPTRFALQQNYPNPFNPSTTIKYSIPEFDLVQLDIHDPLGRLVRRLLHAKQPAGEHIVTWDGRDGNGDMVASGAYFYTLNVGEHTRSSKRMLMVK